MREILFRGKRIDNGEWVEGNLFIPDRADAPTEICIGTNIVRITFDVIPETVGQYTGLTDKNGTKIFEGDIVVGRHWTSRLSKNPEEFHLWRVDWSEKSGLITFVDSPTTKCKLSIHDFLDLSEIEVIGNIHDNPELLKGGASDA